MTTTYHHFLLATPRPEHEIGFRFRAVGDGKTIFRFDREQTFLPKDHERPHFLDSRISNWKSASRIKYRVDYYSPFTVRLTEGRRDEWTGSCYTHTVAVIRSTKEGWKFANKTHHLLLGAIREALAHLSTKGT